MKKYFIVLVCLAMFLWTSKAMALGVTTTTSGSALVGNMLGPGITTSNIVYTGAANASGIFTDGATSGIGIDTGIIVTNGDANFAPGPNILDNSSLINGFPGDADLTAISGSPTFDATILEFDFTSAGSNVFFNYVFASEEYNEFANFPLPFNDVFA